MTLPPEAQIAILNATALGVAWLGIYPTLRPLTMTRLMRADLIVTSATFLAAAGLFHDTGTRFWLPGTQVGWFGFWLVSALTIEMVLALLVLPRLPLGGNE
ncbi:hypothetical protein ACEYYB_05695 [Paracoccus sp. p4-l81]|uniref:hypothetical protein n=1 Tax=unclassified Paracoccus (in: a-proteobacteria) TaxID=2688777 RepID=UPI0035B99246